jgi:hypothetical protein
MPSAHLRAHLRIPSKKASGSREKGKGEGKREKGEGNCRANRARGGSAGPRGSRPLPRVAREVRRRDERREGGEGALAARGHSTAPTRCCADGRSTWATAAEYANAPKFAETWGRWAAAVVRTVPANTNGAPSANDQARAEAGEIVAKVRALVFDQPIPGQGSKKLLRSADIEAMGPDIAAAVRNTGGVAQVLKLEAGTVDVGFYVRDFAAALYAARHPTSEAQSA